MINILISLKQNEGIKYEMFKYSNYIQFKCFRLRLRRARSKLGLFVSFLL